MEEKSKLYEDFSGDEEIPSPKDDLLSPIDPDSPLPIYSSPTSPGTPETAKPAPDFNHPSLGFWSAPLSGGKSRQPPQQENLVPPGIHDNVNVRRTLITDARLDVRDSAGSLQTESRLETLNRERGYHDTESVPQVFDSTLSLPVETHYDVHTHSGIVHSHDDGIHTHLEGIHVRPDGDRAHLEGIHAQPDGIHAQPADRDSEVKEVMHTHLSGYEKEDQHFMIQEPGDGGYGVTGRDHICQELYVDHGHDFVQSKRERDTLPLGVYLLFVFSNMDRFRSISYFIVTRLKETIHFCTLFSEVLTGNAIS